MTKDVACAILAGCQHIHREDANVVESLQMDIDSLGRSEKFKEKAEIVISQLRADRDRLEDVIKKIRAEIEASRWTDKGKIERNALASGLDKALEIIDKCRAESEDKEWQTIL